MSIYPPCPGCGLGSSDLEEGCQRPPNLNDFLFTNRPPYEPHRSEFRRVLERATSSLLQVEAQITFLKQTLFELYQTKSNLDTLIHDCKTALNPVRMMNEDLLYEIFGYFTMPTPDENASIPLDVPLPTSLNRTKEPWVFSQVSHLWRDVAVSYPMLWQNLTLSFGFTDGFTPNGGRGFIGGTLLTNPQTYLLTLQLQRSSNLPLNISLSASSDIHTQNPTLQLLLSSCNRWKHLLLRLEPSGMGLLSPLEGLLPNLEKIWMPSTLSAFTRCTALQYAPELTSVVGFARFMTPLVLPWTQITEFKSPKMFILPASLGSNGGFNTPPEQIWSPEPLFNLLTGMPNLERCFLYCSYDPSSASSLKSKSILRHDRLRDLTLIEAVSSGGARHLLDKLTLPGLERICFGGVQIPTGPILGLFMRSRFRLEKLLLDSYCENQDFISAYDEIQDSESGKTLKVISSLATSKAFLRRMILHPKEGEVRVCETLKTILSKGEYQCDGETLSKLERRFNLKLEVLERLVEV